MMADTRKTDDDNRDADWSIDRRGGTENHEDGDGV